ncbi:anoctamin [Thraustotheca clavata]|uniref:Anoctamin n=1 Tax=Thraustotheca clavata TaxID=74557 RepID=A0A1V9YV15_9STRA|nr:anoctamin [Thraustotheca clavata]
MAEKSELTTPSEVYVRIDDNSLEKAINKPPRLQIQSRHSIMQPRSKPTGATDMVMILPRRSGGEGNRPNHFTQKKFVQLMLGLKDGSQNDLKAVFRSGKCFVANDGIPFTQSNPETFPSADWIKATENNDPLVKDANISELQRRIECLREEYVEYIKSSDNTTEEKFCELVARAIAKRIQLVCGLTTYMVKSQKGDMILLLIQADDGDLKIEAERTKYRLQTSNKPFAPVHAQKLEKFHENNENMIAEAKAHLHVTRGRTKGIYSKPRSPRRPNSPKRVPQTELNQEDEPEMDPWLISKGDEYQVKLHKAITLWGHNEVCDGAFPPPPREEEKSLNMWQRFRNELIYIPKDPYTYFSLYTPYKSNAKYQPYYRHYPEKASSFTEDTLFRQVDRIRLCHSILKQQLNMDALKDAGYFLDLFALHDPEILKHLTHEWALKLTLTSQPIGLLRNYFGEKIALYFSWLEFYTKCLTLPAAVGIVIYVLVGLNIGDVRIAKIFFAFFIVAWSTFFTEFWKRKSALFNVIWGIDAAQDIDTRPRVQYIGTKRMNPNDNSPEIYDMATASARRRRGISYFVVFFMVLVVLVALSGLFFLKHLAARLSDTTQAQWAATGVSLLNSIQITILNKVYRVVAEKLNVWENHRTDVQYEDNLITKVFLFQFCNSFASFFYIAYVKNYIHDSCINDNCLVELRVQLFVLFLVATFVNNLIEVGLPLLLVRINLWRSVKDKSNPHLSNEELQALWAPYEEDDAFADYNEMVIQYGFVTLFVVAMPITPALALLNNIIEVHVDAFKLCKGHRRPFPHPASSIGTWYYFLCMMNYLAVVTNIGILLFTNDPDDSFMMNTTTSTKWVIFLIAEHACIGMKSLVAMAVPDTPRQLEYLQGRHKDIEASVFLGQLADDDRTEDLSQQAEKLNLFIHESSNSPPKL